MRNPIPLTGRDFAILGDCYKSTVLSFSQIHRRHFKENAKATVHNRMTELLRRGYVTKARVGALAHPNGQRNVGVVYQISRTGIRTLRHSDPHSGYRTDPLRLSLYGLRHDLLLNEVVWALQSRYPTTQFRHGRLITGHDVSRIPDAEFTLCGERIALELELTLKSDKRYREIVLQYGVSNSFKKIVYIVASDRIREKIAFQVTGQKPLPDFPRPCTGKFYFVTLSELLKSPKAPITNGDGLLESEV